MEVMKEIKDESIDIIITSPPFNLSINYATYKDNQPREEYLAWMNDIFKEISRILKKNGSFFLNMGGSNVDPWVPYEVAFECRKYLILQNDITWIKSISIDDKSYGHYKPINSKRFLNHIHEKVFHFTHDGKVEINRIAIGVPYADKSNISRWGSKADLRCRGNNWFIPYETITTKEEKGKHPAIFPSNLVKMCVKLHGFDSNTIVFEPFLGSGTTLAVCKELDIIGIGCEIDEEYFEFSRKRLLK